MVKCLLLLSALLVFGVAVAHPTSTTVDPPLYNSYKDVSNNSLIHGSDNLEFELYKERVRILHDMLREECQGHELSRLRRDLSTEVSKVHQEVEMVLYERMTRMLIECRKRKRGITTTPTTIPTTTTYLPQPSECQSAINLTEFWRKDHSGGKIQPGGNYNCDFRDMTNNGAPWFRFTGAAGNMMLDRCPPDYSCGTHAAMWTDAVMPSVVGVQATVNVYGSWSNNCKYFTKPVHVMKCSDKPYDFIYKHYSGDTECTLSFCGMTKPDA